MYIISNKYKIAFKRIYKNAHSSVIKWLKDNDTDIKCKQKAPENYFKFAIIRDPVDRFLSGYIDKFINKYNKDDYKKEYSATKFLKQNKIKKSIPEISLIYLLTNINPKSLLNCDDHFMLQCRCIDINITLYDIKKLDIELNKLAAEKKMKKFSKKHDDNRKAYKYIQDNNLPKMTVKKISEKYNFLPSKDSFKNYFIKSLIQDLYKSDEILYDSILYHSHR